MAEVIYVARAGTLTTSDLYTVDETTAAMTSQGPIGFAVTGLAWDATTSTLYGSTSNNSGANPYSLITIDISTGAGTLVGSLGLGSFRTAAEIAFDASGALWGWDSSGGGLFSIDKSTGAATVISSISNDYSGGMDFNPGGTLYHVGGNNHKVETVNTSTGAVTTVSTLAPTNRWTGGKFRPADGVFWGAQQISSSNVKLVTVNLSTGAVTTVATFPISNVDAFAWAPPPAAPTDDFSASISPATVTVSQGASDTAALSTTITLGAAQSITLSATGVPTGASVTFAANPIMSGGGTTVTLDAGTANLGSYAIVIHLAGATSHTVTVTLRIAGPAQTFNAAVTPWTCGGLVVISSDGASEGARSLMVDARSIDSFINFYSPPVPGVGNWVYTSFALYIPSWATAWDGGNAWDPSVISLNSSAPFGGIYIQPNSPTSGTIESNFGGGVYLDSDPVPDGQWVAVEYAQMFDGTDDHIQIWINNVSTGGIQTPSNGGGAGSATYLTIGDSSWGGNPPPNAVLYYIDEFSYSIYGRIGPVDLSGAFFNGIGSGTQLDACTGLAPVAPAPADDSYSLNQNRVLSVPAPGVLANDYSATNATVATGPTNGTLVLNPDGSFVYTPNSGYYGSDSFTYNGSTGVGTVTIYIQQAIVKAVFDGGLHFKVGGDG